MSWELAVSWLRSRPEHSGLVQSCYFDDPLLGAAQRFAESEEWQAVKELMPHAPGTVLDLGAGRGISSYAFAREGWHVTALEPDTSDLVGSGAIRMLSREAGLSIHVVEQAAETLPFGDESFDVVYGRQVLHHTRNLVGACCEARRVLKRGGVFIATREHVLSKNEDLDTFLDSHPLHRLYGGEHAYKLKEYRAAITSSGLKMRKVFGPLDSPINYFPRSQGDCLAAILSRLCGRRVGCFLSSQQHAAGRLLAKHGLPLVSPLLNTPGRLFSFVAVKV